MERCILLPALNQLPLSHIFWEARSHVEYCSLLKSSIGREGWLGELFVGPNVLLIGENLIWCASFIALLHRKIS